mmetsp:Transcript_47727/g.79188  ORF Transcript_47727/g.79188 Transcript_47727/m.79188 type:complete len:223 (-) Transcript_47727:1182-1850(-)
MITTALSAQHRHAVVEHMTEVNPDHSTIHIHQTTQSQTLWVMNHAMHGHVRDRDQGRDHDPVTKIIIIDLAGNTRSCHPTIHCLTWYSSSSSKRAQRIVRVPNRDLVQLLLDVTAITSMTMTTTMSTNRETTTTTTTKAVITDDPESTTVIIISTDRIDIAVTSIIGRGTATTARMATERVLVTDVVHVMMTKIMEWQRHATMNRCTVNLHSIITLGTSSRC